MKRILISLIISFQTCWVFAKGKELYSCQLSDAWLEKQKSTATLNVHDLDRADLVINSQSESITCPMAVESAQDNSLGKISEVTFKMIPEACTPLEKAFNKNLRRRISLQISTQPGTTPSAKVAWRYRAGYSDCKEIQNSLKEHGIGSRVHSLKTKNNTKPGIN
ncbi:MAG: hypothetical protein KUL82_07620 [Bdellovibrio sp.]|nr:hypothetical protein [Bdellovibrio sp.]